MSREKFARASLANNIRDILRALARTNARVIVIGGVGLQMHGSSYITYDIDLAYERTRENVERIVDSLSPFSPRPRGYPKDLPFVFDTQTIFATDVLTLETTAGDIDLLGTVKGIGSYGNVEKLAETKTFEGNDIRVLSIDGLILAKRAAGRPKDEAGLIELEALREALGIIRGDTGPSDAGLDSESSESGDH